MDMPLLARTRAIAGGILLAAALSACDYVATLDAPLPATEGVELEEGLAGVWVLARATPDDVWMLSVEEAEGETFDIEMLHTTNSPEEDGQGLPFAAGRWQTTPTVIDGRTYYSGRVLSIGWFPLNDWSAPLPTLAEREVYHMGRAEVAADGTLMLHLLVDKDLEPLGLSGTVLGPSNEIFPPVHISHTDPERLRDFIAANADGDIFSFDLGPFVRISGAPSSDEPVEVPAEAPKQ